MMTAREEAHTLVESVPDNEFGIVNDILRRFSCPPDDGLVSEAEADRLARIDAACGALAHVPGSVDDYLARKREETEREEERYRQRHGRI